MTKYIKRFYDIEVYKEVTLQSPFAERFRLYVSNYGNVKKHNLIKGNEIICKPNLTEGYPAISLSLLLPISEEDQTYFAIIRENINVLKLDIASNVTLANLSENPDLSLLEKINENQKLLNKLQENYKKNYKKREQKRKRYYGSLVHRLVAEYFLEKPADDKILVSHLDYDKLNNHHSNLQWMTRDENAAHQKNSPFVIKAKEKVLTGKTRRTNTKLTEKQVMILKKRMNEGVTLRELAKRNKVTVTQLARIKSGENWGKVPAAL